MESQFLKTIETTGHFFLCFANERNFFTNQHETTPHTTQINVI